MKSQHPSRRSLLQTLAIGAGAAPMLPSLGRSFLPNAQAAATGAPRRVIFYNIPNGLPDNDCGPACMGKNPVEYWYAKFGARPADFILGESLKSLERHRSDLVLVHGLEMKLNCPGSPGVSDCPTGSPSHSNANALLLTGSTEVLPWRNNTVRSPNPSIDTYLGVKLGRQVTPRVPNIRLGVQSFYGMGNCFGEDGTNLLNTHDVYDIYKQLFDGLVTGGDPVTDEALLRRLARRQSVLDVVKGDLTAFQARLGAEDRERAQAQLQAIRTLESRLSAASDPQTAGQACQKTDAPVRLDYKDDRNVPKLLELMNGFITTAFACDVTRVISMKVYTDDQSLRLRFDPVNATTESFHGLSHNGSAPSQGFAAYLRARTFFNEHVAALADMLKSIPEAGGTMLDNTLIWVSAEHGQNHEKWNQAWYTLGGRNLGVKTGQALRFSTARKMGNGLEHNRLLVSILNAMGLPDETFGAEVTRGRGPLPGFTS